MNLEGGMNVWTKFNGNPSNIFYWKIRRSAKFWKQKMSEQNILPVHHVLRCFSQDEARSMSDNHFVNCGNLQRLAVKDVKEEWLQYELHFSLFKMWQQQKFIINSQFLFL